MKNSLPVDADHLWLRTAVTLAKNVSSNAATGAGSACVVVGCAPMRRPWMAVLRNSTEPR